MKIVEALHEEEAKLQTQLTAIQGAIAVLNGAAKTAVARSDQQSKRTVKRTMPASVRARISEGEGTMGEDQGRAGPKSEVADSIPSEGVSI